MRELLHTKQAIFALSGALVYLLSKIIASSFGSNPPSAWLIASNVIDTLSVTVVGASVVSVFFQRKMFQSLQDELSENIQFQLNRYLQGLLTNLFFSDPNRTHSGYRWSCVVYPSRDGESIRQFVELEYSFNFELGNPYVLCAQTSDIPDSLKRIREDDTDCILFWTIPEKSDIKLPENFIVRVVIINGKHYVVSSIEDFDSPVPHRKLYLLPDSEKSDIPFLENRALISIDCIHSTTIPETTTIFPKLYRQSSAAEFRLTLANLNESYSILVDSGLAPYQEGARPLIKTYPGPGNSTLAATVSAQYPVLGQSNVVFSISRSNND